ncbi:MAG: membrane protein insertion efficiency factor YidD [Chlamydiales bacterium]|nr:membrane protein insertion efficiency factor YidD [Chlamydiales bacterium]
MKWFFILLIKLYQWCISPFIGPVCRFYPSCSHYAVESFQKHGSIKGFFLTGKRICKCHPWHPGGHDPVP